MVSRKRVGKHHSDPANTLLGNWGLERVALPNIDNSTRGLSGVQWISGGGFFRLWKQKRAVVPISDNPVCPCAVSVMDCSPIWGSWSFNRSGRYRLSSVRRGG